MEKILESTFMNKLNKSTIIEFGEKNLVEKIYKYDKFTSDTKYLAIKKIFQLGTDQIENPDITQSNCSMNDIMEKYF